MITKLVVKGIIHTDVPPNALHVSEVQVNKCNASLYFSNQKVTLYDYESEYNTIDFLIELTEPELSESILSAEMLETLSVDITVNTNNNAEELLELSFVIVYDEDRGCLCQNAEISNVSINDKIA